MFFGNCESQHAASLRAALPKEYIQQLRALQDNAPCRSLDRVMEVLRAEFGSESVDLISLDEDPIGCASLAQVHRATLNDGSVVALKVQHFDLRKLVESDVSLVKTLDYWGSRCFESFNLSWALKDFEENLKKELDFELEARNCERCRLLFESDPSFASKIKIPKVYWKFTSSRVICMELISNAIPIYDTTALTTQNVDLRKVSNNVLEAFACMMFRWGFVHCDPHPGNMLVCAGDKDFPEKVAILDHGLYRELDPSFRISNCNLWRAMLLQDEHVVRTECTAMGIGAFWNMMPFLFVNRPINSASRLGEPAVFGTKDKMQLRKELGIEKVSLASIGSLGDALPNDMIFLLKTMHLIKDVNDILGGTNKDRFLIYGRYAVTSELSVVKNWYNWLRFMTTYYAMDTWVTLFSPAKSNSSEPVSMSTIISEDFNKY